MVPKKIAFLTILILVIPLPDISLNVRAQARTIVVPDDFSTIGQAVENAISGDTIYVKSGTYAERIVLDKALSLKGENKETTVINGDNGGTVILIRHDNVEVTGFSIIYDETANSPVPYWMWSTRLVGVHLLSVSNCSIQGNKISDCGAGIWLYDARENRISDNSIFRCDYGIRVENSIGNTLLGNSITGNWGGLWLLSSNANKLRNNVLSSNTRNFAVAGAEIDNYMNDVDTSNTVDAKPIYYWIGISDRTVPSDAGCVILADCKNITVQALSLRKAQDAILLVQCWKSIVTGNTIIECNSGVRLFNSTYDKIFANDIESSIGVNAVGNGTRIYGNSVKAGGTGIFIEGNYQTVTGNTVDAGEVGAGDKIVQCKGAYNNISHNTLNGQTYVGVLLEGSYNFFYENTVTYGGLRVVGDSNFIGKNKVTYETISISGGPGNVICGNTILNGYDIGVGGHHDTYYANHVETNGLGARIGGIEANVHDNVLHHNNFIISTRTGPVWGVNRANSWDNGSEGNYWSDYNGTDSNHDGKGDTPYFIMSETLDTGIGGVVDVVIGQDNYPLMAPFDVSSLNVEVPTWEIPIWENGGVSPSPSSSPSPKPAQIANPTSSEANTTAEPFPATSLIGIAIAAVAVVGLGLPVYFFKRRLKVEEK